MECLLFHLCLLCLSQALPTKRPTTEGDVFDVGNPDILEINKVLNPNLFEGDIKYPEKQSSTIWNKAKHWTNVIPYHLDSNLDHNAKGVIMQAFDMFRLKSCIDFVPRTDEPDYISLVKDSGCWSYVGKQSGRQKLSIGYRCDQVSIVEHELLHALGIWHEQSRPDRDDYVTIQWNNIQFGRGRNFQKNTLQESDSLNVPYDYLSVMHYGSSAFHKKTGLDTIITRNPMFMELIGQRLHISELDRVQLNRMYNCTSSLALLDRCTFDDLAICGMVQIAADDADWHWVPGTPEDLFFSEVDDGGPFLLFNNTAASPGDVAVIETRVLRPQRAQQCLQIYYQHRGGPDDQLHIAISNSSNSSQFKVVSSIPATNTNRWTLTQVSLSESSPFRLALRAVAGVSAETGGWAVDDLTLTEVSCFPHIWPIPDFTTILDETPAGSPIYSPRFNSTEGYSFQLSMYPNITSQNGQRIYLVVHLTSGDQDEELQWPCPWKQITASVMDQHSDVRLRMSSTGSITTDPDLRISRNGSTVFLWDRPDRIGSKVYNNGSTYFRGPGYVFNTFLPHAHLHRRQFIRRRDMVILIKFEDISLQWKPSTTNSPIPRNSGSRSPTTSSTTAGNSTSTSSTTNSQTTGNSGSTSPTTNSQTTGNSRATSLTTFERSVCSNCESSTTVINDAVRHQDTILYAWITIWSIALISGWI
uniref:meprin A subunit beta-like isoform X2 n=1 Tax=Myxine glutinosa TaxID=7769 RepID=UPI00358F10D0